jgi:Ca2+-binding EF-hand superfamily protein
MEEQDKKRARDSGSGDGLTWWAENKGADTFDPIRLTTMTKWWIEEVFEMLDVDHSGTLTGEDFKESAIRSRTSLHQAANVWNTIRHEFAAKGTGEITPLDFVEGIKRMAVKQTVDVKHMVHEPAVTSYGALMMRFSDALNTSVKRICFTCLASLVILDPPTMAVMAAAWASIDFDADGEVTLSDFVGGPGRPISPSAAEYFDKLRKVLDLNQDGKITKDEFIRGMTMKAIEMLEPSRFKSAAFHREVVPGSLPPASFFQTAVNTSVQSVCRELLTTLVLADGPTKASMETAWKLVDFNGDGKVTLADFARGGRVPLAAASYFETLRQHLDLNGDGTIEKHEFVRGLILKSVEVLDATKPMYTGSMCTQIQAMAYEIATKMSS